MAVEQYGPGYGPDYELRSAAGARCPCGCQDADDDGELDTPAKVRAALLRMEMDDLGIGGIGHEPGARP